MIEVQEDGHPMELMMRKRFETYCHWLGMERKRYDARWWYRKGEEWKDCKTGIRKKRYHRRKRKGFYYGSRLGMPLVQGA